MCEGKKNYLAADAMGVRKPREHEALLCWVAFPFLLSGIKLSPLGFPSSLLGEGGRRPGKPLRRSLQQPRICESTLVGPFFVESRGPENARLFPMGGSPSNIWKPRTISHPYVRPLHTNSIVGLV
jgi:hypothetical protein